MTLWWWWWWQWLASAVYIVIQVVLAVSTDDSVTDQHCLLDNQCHFRQVSDSSSDNDHHNGVPASPPSYMKDDALENTISFTRPHYHVLVPEHGQKVTATVLIPGANRDFPIPDPDPGGGLDLVWKNFHHQNVNKIDNFTDGKSGNSASKSDHQPWSHHVSPYEKMGMYVSDPTLVVRYKILGNSMKKIFTARERKVGDFFFLIIKTRELNLNREDRSHYDFTVIASVSKLVNETESKGKLHQIYATQCNVTVHVEDANDISPYFMPDHYEVTVREDIPMDSKLVSVTAIDQDIGLGGQTYYVLVSSDPLILSMFAVHPTLGIVINTRPLSPPPSRREPSFSSSAAHSSLSPPSSPLLTPSNQHPHRHFSSIPVPYKYNLTITARDRVSMHPRAKTGSSGHNATVVINVIPINRYAPQITIRQLSSAIFPYSPSKSISNQSEWATGGLKDKKLLRKYFSPLVYAVAFVTDEDRDDSIYGNICSFEIVSGNHLRLFQITNSTPNEYLVELIQAPSPSQTSMSTFSSSFTSSINNRSNHHHHRSQHSRRSSDNARNDGNNSQPSSPHMYNGEKLLSTVRGYGLEFNLTLKASDCGGLSTSETISVFINPFNTKSSSAASNLQDSFSYPSILPPFAKKSIISLFKPTFQSDYYFAQIHESVLPGSMIAQVKVKLPFEESSRELESSSHSHMPPTIIYQIEENSDPAHLFGITANGIVYTRSHLDFEEEESYNLIIKARLSANLLTQGDTLGASGRSSSSIAQTNLHIKVIDDNDNGPVFKNKGIKYLTNLGQIIEVTIDESKPMVTHNDSFVIKLIARDEDSGDNGAIRYSLVEPVSGPFVIDGDTGVISTTSSLDYESGPIYYTLKARASDMGTPYRRQSQLMINITIRDLNDNRPKFQQKDCILRLPVTTDPHTEIATLHAVDDDAKSSIVYKLVAPSPSQVQTLQSELYDCFRLDPIHGKLELVCDLTRYFPSFATTKSLPLEMYVNVSASDQVYFADVLPIKVIFTESNLILKSRNFNQPSSIQPLPEFKCVSDVSLYSRAPLFSTHLSKKKSSEETDALNYRDNEVLTEEGDNDYESQNEWTQHAPHFDDNMGELYIRENQQIGLRIARLAAKDLDRGFEGQLVYSMNFHLYDHFKTYSRGIPFNIDWKNGDFIVQDAIDREIQSSYDLNITACDLAQPPQCSSLKLNVIIDDENDNSPLFDRSIYHFSVPEDARLGTKIAEFHASDSDSGASKLIKYSLLNHEGQFTVESDSGVLTTRNVLDRESVSSYELFLRATDSGFPSLSSTVRVIIRVEDVNDNPPIFIESSRAIWIREDYPVGSLLTKVSAHDFDEGQNGQVRYFIRSSSPSIDDDIPYSADKVYNPESDFEERVFSIDELTGNIRLAGKLDFESRQEYQITVIARDEGTPSLESNFTLKLNVEDVDENQFTPKFKVKGHEGGGNLAAEGSVLENSPIGTFVVRLFATDDDCLHCKHPVDYQIVYGDGLGRFTVNEDGKIFTKVVLDREKNWRYWLAVLAKDKSMAPKTALIHVLILIDDVNDNTPVADEPSYSVTIPEDAVTGSVILQIHATDKDLREFNESGAISLPPYSHYSSAKPTENDNNSISVGSNKDETNPLSSFTFRILNPEEDNPFEIDLHNGTLKLISELDHELTAHYILDVEVSESTSPSSITGAERNDNSIQDNDNQSNQPLTSKTPVLIRIANVNDNAPRFKFNPLVCTAYNDLGNQIPICQVIAFDKDYVFGNNDFPESLRTSLNFKLLPGGSGNNLLRIDEKTGAIYFNATNPIPAKHYSLMVTCTDNGHPKRSSQVSVTIKVLTSRVAYHGEPIEIGSSESSLAIDSSSSTSGSTTLTLTTIATDSLTTMADSADSAEMLKDEVVDLLTTPTVTRPEGESETTKFQIVNSRPLFKDKSSIEYIPENAEVGQLVAMFETFDPDPEDLVCVHIDYASETGVFAFVDRALVVAKPLDYEITEQYNLTIMITDGEARNHHNVTIFVKDVNDNFPQFSQETFTINTFENISKGSELLTLRVTDLDVGDKHTFSIYSADSPSTLVKFDLEPWSGVLRTRETLDHEVENQYKMIVEVADSRLSGLSQSTRKGCDLSPKPPSIVAACSHRSFAKIVINVLDINDHRPECLSSFLKAEVMQTSRVGTSVLQVVATDEDEGDNALIWFCIVSGDEHGFFEIDQNLGFIRVARPLHETNQSEFFLRVKISDSGHPSLSTSVNVGITITSPSNQSPTFVRKEYSFELSENSQVGTIIGAVQAISGQPLFYEMISSSFLPNSCGSSSFSISASTGEFFLLDKLDYELCRKYELIVTATNLMRMNDTTRVSINVLDVNDNPPTWIRRRYHGKILGSMVTALDGRSPLIMEAFDLDSNQNGLIRYQINERQERDYFNIDTTSSAIILRYPVVYERRQEFTFTVSAFDLGSPVSLKSIVDAHVTISFENIDDCTPSFDRQSYHATLYLPTYPDIRVIRLNASSCEADQPHQKRKEVHHVHHLISTLKYSLLDTSEASKKFTINQTSGLITVSNADLLSEGMYQLHVTVYDGKHSAQTVIMIESKSLPKSSLHFQRSKFIGHVLENSTEPKVVLHLPVVGTSVREHLHFSILTDNSDARLFQVNPTSGAVRSVGIPLDREKKAEHLLILEVRNIFHPKRIDHCVLSIIVDDLNDNTPLFVNETYFFTVKSNFPINEPIGRVQAIDADYGPNGFVNYHILSGDTRKLFTVNLEIGYISLIRPVDLTIDQLNYSLTLEAVDAGFNPLRSTKNISILIIEEYDITSTPSPPSTITTIASTTTTSSTTSISVKKSQDSVNSSFNIKRNQINFNDLIRENPSFLWDDLLLPGIFALIVLFSCLVILFCCYFTRSRLKKRHNRTPNNIYRAAINGNEFLLKNCNSFTENNVNMKRFSKLTPIESSSLLGHGQFSSSEPLPNLHFHQALANSGKPMANSFNDTLNNFDDDHIVNNFDEE
ncbi:fat-like cadherin-related tumor suppressor homolog isoform X2 [Brevipalpus obovatus]|uniref:fat-like cadherin-related tumor suppressor homolog isoform X2 n=1 Tax=Brevipalpus obovatus TaxID=246614 RepID=UPI003D9EF616